MRCRRRVPGWLRKPLLLVGGSLLAVSVGPRRAETGEAGPPVQPVTFLYQNFPNPFPHPELGGGQTRIWFDLARTAFVELAVLDGRGGRVRQLIPRPGCPPVELPPGIYGREGDVSADGCMSFTWDGRDDQGRTVAPGVYLLRLRAGREEQTRRMVFWP